MAGPWTALQTWRKLTTKPDVSGHFTEPQGLPPEWQGSPFGTGWPYPGVQPPGSSPSSVESSL